MKGWNILSLITFIQLIFLLYLHRIMGQFVVTVPKTSHSQFDGADPLNSIAWYNEDDNLVGNGNPLVLPNVTSSFSGNYYAIEYDLGLVIVQTSNVPNVEISEVSSDKAYAGEDQHLCYVTTLTNLSGVEPVVGSGYWITDASNTSVATIVNPTLANTIISNLVTGTYTFRWTLSNGACTRYDYDELTITVGSVLAAPTYFGDDGVCYGGLLFMQGNTAPAGATYHWEGPNGFVSIEENPVISNPELSNEGSYLVTVTDALGCSNFGAVNVDLIIETVDQPIISSNLPLCEGDNLVLSTLQIQGDSVNYFWSGPNGKSTANGDYPNSPNVIVENISLTDIGNYSVNIIANSCSSINSVDFYVNVNGNPQVNPTSSSVGVTCVSGTSSIGLLANAMGGTSPYSYSWNGPEGFNSNVGNQ